MVRVYGNLTRRGHIPAEVTASKVWTMKRRAETRRLNKLGRLADVPAGTGSAQRANGDAARLGKAVQLSDDGITARRSGDLDRSAALLEQALEILDGRCPNFLGHGGGAQGDGNGRPGQGRR